MPMLERCRLSNDLKWLADLRQWWRRSGRDQTFPIDGVTGPTKPVGTHQVVVRNDDFPAYSTSITVSEEKPVTLRHRFGS